MNYNNVLIFKYNEIIIFYNQLKFSLLLCSDVYKKGLIVDNERFIKCYLEFLKKNKISKLWMYKKIKIYYKGYYTFNDINNTYKVFKDLNYNKIELINESKIIKLKKDISYLLIDEILELYYIDKFNSKKMLLLNPNELSAKEIMTLIKNRVLKKELIIIGQCNMEYIDLNINYMSMRIMIIFLKIHVKKITMLYLI